MIEYAKKNLPCKSKCKTSLSLVAFLKTLLRVQPRARYNQWHRTITILTFTAPDNPISSLDFS